MATNLSEWFALAGMKEPEVKDDSSSTSTCAEISRISTNPIEQLHDVVFDENTYCAKNNIIRGFFFATRFDSCNLSDTRIESCAFVNVSFLGCQFDSVTWNNVYLKDVIFVNCTFDDDVWRNDHWQAKALDGQKLVKHTQIGVYDDIPPELSDGTWIREQQQGLFRFSAGESMAEVVDLDLAHEPQSEGYEQHGISCTTRECKASSAEETRRAQWKTLDAGAEPTLSELRNSIRMQQPKAINRDQFGGRPDHPYFPRKDS